VSDLMGESVKKDFTSQCHHLRWLTEHLDGWQFGEQGLIDAIAAALKLTAGMWIEYGAGDGQQLPLTIERFCDKNPSFCVLVEIDPVRQLKLKTRYPEAAVTKTIDWNCGYLDQPDVVVIDIDGSDSVVMREMLEAGVRPTLLVVEHLDNHYPIGTSTPDPIPEWMLGMKFESGHAIQDTAETLHAMAAQHGYERIGFNRCNSFFVVAERYMDLFR
jgi:hypothetical protein